MIPGMRTLIAPDKFKGTLSAEQVVAAIAAGLPAEGETDICSLGDGGEGTAAALLAAVGGEWIERRSSDALGRPVDCRIAMLADGTAALDVADAIGLWRCAEDERDPLGASSAGAGRLIAAAIEAGARTVLVGCGGTATTDGGLGALAEFDPGAAEIVCLCDTRLPFGQAADVFAPQKGAGPDEVAELAERLANVAVELPHDPRRLPFTGAGGGLSGGLWAHGARLVGGARHVLAAAGFDSRLERAELVITGEGRLDATSFNGKLVGEVAARSRDRGVSCWAIVAGTELDGSDLAGSGLAGYLEAGDPAAIAVAAAAIAELAGE